MLKSLAFWVILGIILGIILGCVHKELALNVKVGADYFIHALKILIGPIIFVTIILGIISLDNLKKVGSIGLKSVIYFELVSTLALAVGIFITNILKPGANMNLNPNEIDSKGIEQYLAKTNGDISASSEIIQILKDAIPTDLISPFTEGKTLQVLVLAILTALIISLMKNEDKQSIQKVFEVVQNFVFKILQIIMYFSPVAAFCAMAFLIAQYGLSSLLNLGYLLLVMLCLSYIYLWNFRDYLLFGEGQYL